MARSKRPPSETISFRVTPEMDEELEAAARATGTSKHHYARMLVYRGLRTAEADVAADIRDEVRRSLRDYGADLSFVSKVLLTKLLKLDQAAVEAWLTEQQVGRPDRED